MDDNQDRTDAPADLGTAPLCVGDETEKGVQDEGESLDSGASEAGAPPSWILDEVEGRSPQTQDADDPADMVGAESPDDTEAAEAGAPPTWVIEEVEGSGPEIPDPGSGVDADAQDHLVSALPKAENAGVPPFKVGEEVDAERFETPEENETPI